MYYVILVGIFINTLISLKLFSSYFFISNSKYMRYEKFISLVFIQLLFRIIYLWCNVICFILFRVLRHAEKYLKIEITLCAERVSQGVVFHKLQLHTIHVNFLKTVSVVVFRTVILKGLKCDSFVYSSQEDLFYYYVPGLSGFPINIHEYLSNSFNFLLTVLGCKNKCLNVICYFV